MPDGFQLWSRWWRWLYRRAWSSRNASASFCNHNFTTNHLIHGGNIFLFCKDLSCWNLLKLSFQHSSWLFSCFLVCIEYLVFLSWYHMSAIPRIVGESFTRSCSGSFQSSCIGIVGKWLLLTMSYASSHRESGHQRALSDEDHSVDKSNSPGSEPSLNVDTTLGRHKVVGTWYLYHFMSY